LHHLLIAVALLAAVGLNLIFISFSDEPSAALTFSLLSYFIMLLLQRLRRKLRARYGKLHWVSRTFGPKRYPGLCVPLLVAFLPDLDDPLAPNATVQLGSTFAVFWLLMSLALVGVVQGFLWPHSGVFQAVIVGGLVVATQGLLSWAKVDASWQDLQLALYTWMVWVSVCLIGAWVGLLLREVGGFQPGGVPEITGEESPSYVVDLGEE